jgi:hypothetical protein
LQITKQSKDEATDVLMSNEEKKRAGETMAPKEPTDILQALNTIIKSYLPSAVNAATKFNLETFRDKLFLDTLYPVNKSWYDDHAVMACPAKHFLERFSVQGEFFEKYD